MTSILYWHNPRNPNPMLKISIRIRLRNRWPVYASFQPICIDQIIYSQQHYRCDRPTRQLLTCFPEAPRLMVRSLMRPAWH